MSPIRRTSPVRTALNRGLAPAALLTIFALAVLAPGRPTPLHAQDEPERTPCELVPNKWAEPGTILLGEQVTVTLTSTTACPEARVPLRVVLAIDSSNSMQNNNKLRDAQDAARDFVLRLDFAYSKVGVVAFSDRGYVMQEITDNRARVIGAINDLDFVFGTDMGVQAARMLLDPDDVLQSASNMLTYEMARQAVIEAARRVAGAERLPAYLQVLPSVLFTRRDPQPIEAFLERRSTGDGEGEP